MTLREQEMLEKAMSFICDMGLFDNFEEDTGVNMTDKEKERWAPNALYPPEMDDEEIWAVINTPSRMEIATDEELEKELRSFDSSDLFEEEDC